MKIPVMIQMQSNENGATALCMMLGYYKRYVSIQEMRDKCISSRNGSSPEQIAEAAAYYGLDATIETVTADQLRDMKFPVMIRWKKRYYALIKSIRGNIVKVVDPASGEYKLEMKKLEQIFTGTVISFEKNENFRTGGKQETLMSLIMERMKPLAGTMWGVLIFTLVCILVNLAMMKDKQMMLDKVLGEDHPDAKVAGYFLLLIYFALMIVYTASGMTRTRLINRSSRKASADSGIGLFKKIFTQPMRFFEQYSSWDLLSRIETNVTLDNSILKTFAPRLIDAVMSVIYLIYLFMYNAHIAAACVVVAVIGILASLFVQEKNAIASKSITTSSNSVSASLLNGMNMIDTIKSSGAERSFYNMWRTSQLECTNSKKSQTVYSALSGAISSLSGNILQALQLFMGAYFVVQGNFTLGGMSLFQGVLSSMISSMNNCISTANQLQTMRTGIERINDITRRESREAIPLEDGSDAADKLAGRISARDICYRYNKGDDLALDHVSIEAAPGQMIAIVGSTGCGKSTLLKILADLYSAESGEILYDDIHRGDIPDVVFHSSVTTVDQESVMFEDSIYNNITMWDSTIENYEVILAAIDAQIHERILKERKDYGAMIEENGRNFSGGELQRFELARALAHEPTLLLLDEFTSALDALTEENAMNAIKAKGTTCIIVAHRLSTIVGCDRIYVMDKGRIVQEGTHAELYQQEGLYRTLVG